MKKLIFFLSIILFICISYYSINNDSELLLKNVEAIYGGESSTGNTGPGSQYTCKNWLGQVTGHGKDCLCTNDNDCTEHSCD